MKSQRHQLRGTFEASLLLLVASLPAFADYKVVNNGDKPLMAIQLTNSKGDEKTAKIFIAPKSEMTFGEDGWPASGAGFIEAEEGRTYYVPFMWEGKDGKMAFGGLRVQRIEWDKIRTTYFNQGTSEGV